MKKDAGQLGRGGNVGWTAATLPGAGGPQGRWILLKKMDHPFTWVDSFVHLRSNG